MANETSITVENNDVVIEMGSPLVYWSSLLGSPSSSTTLVSYLNTLLAKKQDICYYIVATESDKDSLTSKKTGTLVFVKATKKLYVYYSEDSVTEWVSLIQDIPAILKSLSGYDSTKTQTLKNVKGTLTWATDSAE